MQQTQVSIYRTIGPLVLFLTKRKKKVKKHVVWVYQSFYQTYIIDLFTISFFIKIILFKKLKKAFLECLLCVIYCHAISKYFFFHFILIILVLLEYFDPITKTQHFSKAVN